LERRSGIGVHNPIASEKTIAVMTVDFVTIKISSTCENRAGVEIIIVVLD
jgi:hypothetical protein